MKNGLALIVCWLAVSYAARAEAATQTTCLQLKPYKTEIAINLEVPDPYYDLAKNKSQVNSAGQATREEWLARNNMHGIWSSNHMTRWGRRQGAGLPIIHGASRGSRWISMGPIPASS
jgi:hypothetical protein